MIHRNQTQTRTALPFALSFLALNGGACCASGQPAFLSCPTMNIDILVEIQWPRGRTKRQLAGSEHIANAGNAYRDEDSPPARVFRERQPRGLLQALIFGYPDLSVFSA